APAAPAASPLPLHDALPICRRHGAGPGRGDREREEQKAMARAASHRRDNVRESTGTSNIGRCRKRDDNSLFVATRPRSRPTEMTDRKSTRLNSSHDQISYAV